MNVAVAPADPADADAIPEGSELRARTLSVFDGAHAVTPGALSDADYLYDLLSSETGDIAVLSADIRTPEAAANAAFIQNNPPPPEYTSIL
ncbi:MAG: hypothetical protein LBC26_05620 [Oscillospiraceae bacterium]|nr:hypothetical protein [Oscillospiraceae bacterium]